MPKYDSTVIEKYRQLLKKDPNSQAFAPLADAYREAGELILSERIVREGLRRHPDFSSGLVVLAKILKDQKKLDEALSVAQKASQSSADNLLSHQLEGDILLEMKKPQEALKAYKMVLFLNPQSVKARKIVQKLESLTAADYEEDVFAMTKLEPLNLHAADTKPDVSRDTSMTKLKKNISEFPVPTLARSLQRTLSLLDAFIVRNDLNKAHEILTQAKQEFGSQPELDKREKILRARNQTALLVGNESAAEALPIQPRMSREHEIAQRKLEKLQMLLRKIEEHKSLI